MQSHIKEIECDISHPYTKAVPEEEEANRARHHAMVSVQCQDSHIPESPLLLLLSGCNMFNTEHIESAGLFHNIVLSLVSAN